jgi:hypothetical protein
MLSVHNPKDVWEVETLNVVHKILDRHQCRNTHSQLAAVQGIQVHVITCQ